MTRLISFYFLICSLTPLYSQSVTWQKILNNNYGLFVKAHQTPDGGFIAVGSDIIANSTYKIYLQKFAANGDSLWARFIGLMQDDNYDGYWIENTYDNGFIICGDHQGDGYLVKTDSVGNVQWTKSYGGADLDQAKCVKQTPDSGYIVLLRTTSFTGFNNIMLVKTDLNGTEQWEKVFLANNTQFGNEVIVSKSSYFIIGSAFSDLYLINTNLNGDTLWTKRYGGTGVDEGYAVQKATDNGLILGGNSDSNGTTNSIIIKTDSLGEVEWQKKYTAKYNEILFSLRNLAGRGYVFCGTTDSVFNDYERGFVRIIDFNGNVLSQKFYRPLQYYTEIRSVENTNDNSFIICGVTQMIQGGVPKMYIARTDSMGNIFPVSISNYSSLMPIETWLFQNYPNPFNPFTVINFDINEKSEVSLLIYDMLGKRITSLVSEMLMAGRYRVKFNPSEYELSTGIYFIQLKTGKNIQTRRMIYLK